ncbi:MAG: D-alanine--D-alanine ligase [Cytophagales bacterium]|nr:D-alanine--D-alanine ligase [Cytophagales bacterium]
MFKSGIRVGILLGGISREREVSLAGGRTVYDNLDRSLFSPVPIFVNAKGWPILLDWRHLYKGTLRDFYPPPERIKDHTHFSVYEDAFEEAILDEWTKDVGRRISWDKLSEHVDVVFLCLHGHGGEDGSIQGLLEWIKLPYTGAGILPSALCMDKAFQHSYLKDLNFHVPKSLLISRTEWLKSPDMIVKRLREQDFSSCVVKPSREGSSIGLSLVSQWEHLSKALDKAFFIRRLPMRNWDKFSESERRIFLQNLTDLRHQIGFPLSIGERTFSLPEELSDYLSQSADLKRSYILEGFHTESEVLVEEALADHREFSCVVMEDEFQKPRALPPTEIEKPYATYDYTAKYLPGISRKQTPMSLPEPDLKHIQSSCEKLYTALGGEVYARIDGFYEEKTAKCFLNDPNTTSGMLPSSLFFQQAAEVNLNPRDLLTHIIKSSLWHRQRDQKRSLNHLSSKDISTIQGSLKRKKKKSLERVAILTGGPSSERHIALETARNVYEKLSSSGVYHPSPYLISSALPTEQVYPLPLRLLLKDHAEDVKEGSISSDLRPMDYEQLRDENDLVFLATHGRPGEDGTLQKVLEAHGIPYNGSGPSTSALCMHKYNTYQFLVQEGFRVPSHEILYKGVFQEDPKRVLEGLCENLGSFPLIVKPIDDGCSTGVLRVGDVESLHKGLSNLFNEREEILVEECIEADTEFPFCTEITIGLMGNHPSYEIFVPSEIGVKKDVLTLSEKFLAGEGQNITPARFSIQKIENEHITSCVKDIIQKLAISLKIDGYARVDAFVRISSQKQMELIVIEINTLPGLTPATCLFHQAAQQGYTPLSFLSRILDLSCQRFDRVF